MSRWVSADPPIAKGEYFPSLDDMIAAQNNNEEYKLEESLPGIGGVYNPINLDAYHYAGQNPVKFVDPDGNAVLFISGKAEGAYGPGKEGSFGIAIQFGTKTDFKVYYYASQNTTAGIRADAGLDASLVLFGSFEDYFDSEFVKGSFDAGMFGGGLGFASKNGFNMLINFSVGAGYGGSYGICGHGKAKYIEMGDAHKSAGRIGSHINEMIRAYSAGDQQGIDNALNKFVNEVNQLNKNIKDK